MSPEGKPIQVNASALQAAGAQNTIGTLTSGNWIIFTCFPELSIRWLRIK